MSPSYHKHTFFQIMLSAGKLFIQNSFLIVSFLVTIKVILFAINYYFQYLGIFTVYSEKTEDIYVYFILLLFAVVCLLNFIMGIYLSLVIQKTFKIKHMMLKP